MKKKGFTLIELLAVLIVLAVISLIALPSVLKAINEARKSAFEENVNRLVKAIELKINEDRLDGNNFENFYVFPNKELVTKGKQPKGFASVNKDGNIQLSVYDDDFCAVKDYNSNIALKEKTECNISTTDTSYDANFISYDINYDVCVYALNQYSVMFDIDKICKGENDPSGLSLNYVLESGMYSYEDFVSNGIIENYKTTKQNISCFEYEALSDGTLKIIGYNCVTGNKYGLPEIDNVIVPTKSKDNIEITEIGSYAFNYSSVKNIYLPKTITKIDTNGLATYSTVDNIVIDSKKGKITGDPFGSSIGVKITYLDGMSNSLSSQKTILEAAKKLVYESNSCKTDGSTYQYMGGCYIKNSPQANLQNHIWYNGFLFRIMGINSDGSVRLITEGGVSSVSYDDSSSNFSGSNIDNWLNDYFYNKLSNTNGIKNIIVDGTFCQGAQTTSNISRTTCDGTTLTRKVGLLSIDELNMSGNIFSYLQNSLISWTMSPISDELVWNAYALLMDPGDMIHVTKGFSVRPVINVKADTLVTSGSGALSDYYVLYENDSNSNLDNIKIGEYVSFNNYIYRVVENNDSIKLILDETYKKNGEIYEVIFGEDSIFTPNNNQEVYGEQYPGIGYVLNTEILNGLTRGSKQNDLKNVILNSKWYQTYYDDGEPYTISLDESSSFVEAKVGLIRLGEMLAGQSYSMFTKKGTIASSIFSREYNYFLVLNRYGARYIESEGRVKSDGPSNDFPFRPVINIDKTKVKITSGDGRPNTPYIIELK